MPAKAKPAANKTAPKAKPVAKKAMPAKAKLGANGSFLN